MDTCVLFLFMQLANYIKGSVTIEAKLHKNLFQICVKYFFFGNLLFFFPFCDWTELWEKNPGKIMCLTIVSGIKKPVRIK